jgi:hypothetical protein
MYQNTINIITNPEEIRKILSRRHKQISTYIINEHHIVVLDGNKYIIIDNSAGNAAEIKVLAMKETEAIPVLVLNARQTPLIAIPGNVLQQLKEMTGAHQIVLTITRGRGPMKIIMIK